MSSGVLLSYFSIKISFWLLLLTQGLMFGVGVGIASAGPLGCTMRWMPRWKGVSNGFTASGIGFGALIFDQLQTQYINPHNVKPTDGYFTHEDLLDRVPIIFLILGTTYAILQVLGALLLSNPPQDLDFKNNDDDPLTNGGEEMRNIENYEIECEINNSHTNMPSIESDNPQSDENEFKDKLVSPVFGKINSQQILSSPSSSSSPPPTDNPGLPDVHPLKMLKLFGFYHLWSMALLASFSINFMGTFSKVYGLTFIRDDHFLSAVESISAIFNSVGRFIWGLVADKFSLETALILRSGIITAFLLTFYATSAVEFGKPMFLIWMCVIFFCNGGISSLFTTTVSHTFGTKYVSINYGFLVTSHIGAGVVSALVFPVMLSHLQWRGLIFLVSGLSAADLVLTLLYWRKELKTTFHLTFPRELMRNIHIRYLKYCVHKNMETSL